MEEKGIMMEEKGIMMEEYNMFFNKLMFVILIYKFYL